MNQTHDQLITGLRRGAELLLRAFVHARDSGKSELRLKPEGLVRATDLMFSAAWALQRSEEIAASAPSCPCESKPRRELVQIDGYADIEPGDCVMVPDDDGDVLTKGNRREPQSSDTTVRTLIAAHANQSDVLRLLRKQIAWIEREGIWKEEPPF